MTREKKKQFRQSRNACLIVAVPYMSWRISFQGPLSRTPLFAIALKYELCSRQAAKTKGTLLKSWQNSTIKGCRSFCRNMRYEHYSMSRTSWMDLLAKFGWCRIGRRWQLGWPENGKLHLLDLTLCVTSLQNMYCLISNPLICMLEHLSWLEGFLDNGSNTVTIWVAAVCGCPCSIFRTHKASLGWMWVHTLMIRVNSASSTVLYKINMARSWIAFASIR